MNIISAPAQDVERDFTFFKDIASVSSAEIFKKGFGNSLVQQPERRV